MEEKIASWVAWLTVRGLSVHTREVYTWHVRRMVREFPDRPPGSFSVDDLTRYLAARAGEWGESSRKLAANALRSFFGWMYGDESPAARLPVLRPHRRRQRSLSAAEVDSVAAVFDTATPLGKRDLAIFALMLDTGLRASEVCRLRLADVDLSARSLLVVVKGGQEKFGVFTEFTANAILSWLSVRPGMAADAAATLFVSVRGGALTRSGLVVLFRRVGKRAGVARFSPHALRRTPHRESPSFAAATRVVQEAGRWENLDMVEHYTRNLDARVWEKWSPVARLLGKAIKQQA